MAHDLDAYGGSHLAHDVNHPDGGPATVDAPVHAVADGVVRYAGPNGSSYVHVVLIEHAAGDGGGEVVCSFYGHINAPVVATGDVVARGQQVASVRDWSVIQQGGSVYNTHLHYAILASRCATRRRRPAGRWSAVTTRAARATCSTSRASRTRTSRSPTSAAQYGDVFLSPTQFIAANHF